MADKRYKLTVSGIVTYPNDDSSLRDFLQSDVDAKGKLSEALQELEEEAIEVTVNLEEIS